MGSVIDQLIEDIQYIRRQINDRSPIGQPDEENQAICSFAAGYLLANKKLITRVANDVYHVPEEVRKANDPYPDDGTWHEEKRSWALHAVPEQMDLVPEYGFGIDDDNLNMLVRVLRLATGLEISLNEEQLLFSPASQTFNDERLPAHWLGVWSGE